MLPRSGPHDEHGPPVTGDGPPVAPHRGLPRRLVAFALRGAILLALLFVVGRAVGSREWTRGLARVQRAGWPLISVLLATPVALACDAMGWRQILRNLGARVDWLALTRIRLISETLVLALPGGAMMAEAAKLALLRKEGSVGASTATASLALARALHMAAAAAYVGLAGVCLWSLPGAAFGPWRARMLIFTFGAALVTALASRILMALLAEARLATRIADRLERLPWRRLAGAVSKHRRQLDEIDVHTARYFHATARARAGAGLPFFAQWLVDGAETALILTLLGADVGLRGALVVDAITSFARATAVFVPAGLGVQEATQVFLLHALGARDDVATAAGLIFMKRMKELFWIVTGALLSAGTRRSWQSRA